MNRLVEVLKVSLCLGLTSFGGPIAHLAYFREEYVKRRRWITEESYADLVALCQFLPGPASSQVSIAIGIGRAGLLGGLLAWVGFTLPSFILMIAFAFVLQGLDVRDTGWLHGLMIAAVAVVAQAVWGMAAKLANGKGTAAIAIASAITALSIPSPFIQAGVIAASGLIGWRCLRADDARIYEPLLSTISRRTGACFLSTFGVLLLALPLLHVALTGHGLALFDSFYRAGALVYGGGHVVLPLLQQSVVPTGWMTEDQFLAGYGAAQAVPGPLFTLAAYLGFVSEPTPNNIEGALLAVVAIFLPAYLLVAGSLPFWNVIRTKPAFRSALSGINAGVVGILMAALYDPVWMSAIRSGADFALALTAFGLLTVWKMPPWVVVAVSTLGGLAVQYI
ncbi:chromate efflux transporter [Paenibacillus sp. OV219]|uniref:chromate efflux transporter n=1 Tax=Paenibacillus sp. OV219 TaxID=1884377 RepID=UPI0008BDA3D1|nr:chromate efflux transporter [Paenibacillus sp. OV219]SEP18921.1 chromate transporter [Paenibacillus sp. OV219]